MPDLRFTHPRLAQIYDALEPDRPDLDAYVELVVELGAHTVLDIGCGTGTFACRLAQYGLHVTGLDPAQASLDVARLKPGAEKVHWILGSATALPQMVVDVVTMTGNVAQVFVAEEDWNSTLHIVRQALGPEGRFIFETRNPARKAWTLWSRQQSYRRVIIDGVGPVEKWDEVQQAHDGLVSFRTTFVFEHDGAVMTSESTLRFRDRSEIADSLQAAGLAVEEVRDAPDRPGLEFVFIARAGITRPN